MKLQKNQPFLKIVCEAKLINVTPGTQLDIEYLPFKGFSVSFLLDEVLNLMTYWKIQCLPHSL